MGLLGMAMVAGAAVLFMGAAVVYGFVRQKYLHIWLPSYIARKFRRARTQAVTGPRHILFCVADHFEPEHGRPPFARAQARVLAWAERYPQIAARHVDADGVHPAHTFFFPEEEYKPEYFAPLQQICRQGYGEVEVHLHHDRDTSAGFRKKLVEFKQTLERHGCLAHDARGQGRYGFIHGNWCLDNSRPDGRWCGVNDELDILRETGCYADFTLPAAPSPAQTQQINSIYYASDDPARPKSHNRGRAACVGVKDAAALLLIQGPLALNWRERSRGIFPRIENGDLSSNYPPTAARVDLWIEQGIGVRGRPDWIFVKVHAHGANESEHAVLLGKPMDSMFSYLESRYNDGKDYVLHYVTAREMYNMVRAAEDGKCGNPSLYRDYEILRPSYCDRGAGTRPSNVIELTIKERVS